MWETELVTLLRLIIDDMDPTAYRYTDERLGVVVINAALLVLMDVDFDNKYVIDLDAGTIVPDPANRATNTRDDVFLNLAVLRAACFVDTSETRLASKQAIDIQDGSSRISLKGTLEGRLKLLEIGPCAAYKVARDEYRAGNRYTAGEAILGPYRYYSAHGYGGYPSYGTNAGYYEGYRR